MQESPLLISSILRHGEYVYADKKVFTITPDGVDEATFFQISKRAEQLAAALAKLGIEARGIVATFMWNNQAPHGGVPRGAEHGCRAAHAQHPTVSRATRLHH